MSQFVLRDATISSARVRMLLSGPTKSGKTFQALIIARSLIDALKRVDKLKGDGSIALICSEHGRAEMWYADVIPFKNLTLPAFDPSTYISALNFVVSKNPSVTIIDQISHEWSGEGGLLEQHAERTKESKSGNSFVEWRVSTPIHGKFINALNTCPTHLICTTRAVQDWVLETVDNGRGGTVQKPTRIGVRPEQRKDAEYEFDIFGNITQDHHITFDSRGKLSLKLSGGRVWKPGPDILHPGEISLIGDVIAQWVSESLDTINPDRISLDQIDELKFHASQLGIGDKGWRQVLSDWKVDDITLFTPKQAGVLLEHFKKQISESESTGGKKSKKLVNV